MKATRPRPNADLALIFERTTSESDYAEVLALRHAAYLGARKIDARLPVSEMSDTFDSVSHVFHARHGGKIIASLRATLLDDGDATDHGRYVAYPADFPALSLCVESSRLCVDPAYQGGGLLAPMMGHLVAFALENNRRYVYGGAAGHLIDVYRRYGARTIGEPYRNTALGGTEHRLILLDAAELALGQGVSEEIWLRAYSDISVGF